MEETMNALRIKDNKAVKVKRISKIQWSDMKTNEMYLLHIDIELLY